MRLRLSGLVLCAAVLAAASIGCAAKARHIATVTVISAKGALDLAQDLEPLTVCGAATAAPKPACVDNVDRDMNGKTAHQRIHAQLADGYALHKQLAIAVRDWPQGQPAPAAIATYLAQITEIMQHVLDALPPGSVKDRLTGFLSGGKS